MKSKTIGLLAGITLVGIVLAIVVNREPTTTIPQSGQLLFPEFMSVVNDVNEVAIETNKGLGASGGIGFLYIEKAR